MADRKVGWKRPPGKWPDKTEAERFWEKVEKGPNPDDCWLWTAATNSRGYGLFKRADGTVSPAHRYLIGPITERYTDHRPSCPKNCVNPAHIRPHTLADDVRFWQYVDIADPDGCWIWSGPTTTQGYGGFSIGNQRKVSAHRWAYRHLVGPIPANAGLDHTVCRTKLCVNPWHVVPRSKSDHIYQPDSTVGIRRDKTHCVHGHEFTKENTRLRPGVNYPRRACITCDREASKRCWTRRRLANAARGVK